MRFLFGGGILIAIKDKKPSDLFLEELDILPFYATGRT
jgi:hypothetical protein